VKWRSISQCSIFTNQQLKVSNIFLCSCCFRPTAFVPFRTHAHQPVYRLLSLTKASNPFPVTLQQLFSIQNPGFRNVSIRALSSYDILPITKVIGLTAIMTWNIYEFRAFYNAMLHVNVKIMTSQKGGTCCSITLIIKSTFCSVVKFVLEVCVSVNLTYVK